MTFSIFEHIRRFASSKKCFKIREIRVDSVIKRKRLSGAAFDLTESLDYCNIEDIFS